MNIAIIGADQGLGLVLVKKFLANKHQVAAGCVSESVCRDYKDLIALHEQNLLRFTTDVTDHELMLKNASEIRDVYGLVDAVVCVAGILTDADRTLDLLNISMVDIHKSLNVNAIGVISVFQAFYPIVKKNGNSFMIAVTSEAGCLSANGKVFSAYSISKAAANKVVGIMQATVDDVRIYAMHPGRMNTEMGRTTALIEPEETADEIYEIITMQKEIGKDAGWFINYKGERMPY